MELNAEQIKKALECCPNRSCGVDCPYYEAEICTLEIMRDALALINSYEQRIKELEADCEQWRSDWAENQARWEIAYDELDKEKHNIELTLVGVMFFVDKWLNGAELEKDEVNRAITMREKTLQIVEKLTEENERLRDTAYRLECEVHRERADTVRKMQERLTKEFDRLHKNNFMTAEVRQWIIDQIAKEMQGEEKQ